MLGVSFILRSYQEGKVYVCQLCVVAESPGEDDVPHGTMLAPERPARQWPLGVLFEVFEGCAQGG